jgi:hypothetical protein
LGQKRQKFFPSETICWIKWFLFFFSKKITLFYEASRFFPIETNFPILRSSIWDAFYDSILSSIYIEISIRYLSIISYRNIDRISFPISNNDVLLQHHPSKVRQENEGCRLKLGVYSFSHTKKKLF